MSQTPPARTATTPPHAYLLFRDRLTEYMELLELAKALLTVFHKTPVRNFPIDSKNVIGNMFVYRLPTIGIATVLTTFVADCNTMTKRKLADKF